LLTPALRGVGVHGATVVGRTRVNAGEAVKRTVLRDEGTTDTTRSGVWSVAFGLLSQAGLAWIWALSAGVDLGTSDAVAEVIALLLPVGVVGALAGGVHAYPGTGRRLAVVGIFLAGAAVVGLLAVLLVGG
jgi:hypothetical protein